MNTAAAQSKINRQYQSDFSFNSRAAFFCLLFFTGFFLIVSDASGQTESPDETVAVKNPQTSSREISQDNSKEVPPPLKLLSKEEKTALEAQTDLKKRTILTLELMDARLVKAETLKTKEEYSQMFAELGAFHALMDNTLDFLKRNNTGSGKVLNNFKRIELSLRKDITRLELIRRDLPPEYDPYVRSLVKLVREARSRAVEPLFGNTVL